MKLFDLLADPGQGEQHSNNAAVVEDANQVAGVRTEDRAQAFLGAPSKLFDRFSALAIPLASSR